LLLPSFQHKCCCCNAAFEMLTLVYFTSIPRGVQYYVCDPANIFLTFTFSATPHPRKRKLGLQVGSGRPPTITR
jgi:hypothetical protein